MSASASNILRDAPPPCPVLVVDDDALVAEHLAIHLGQAGYEVTTAASASEALRRIESEPCEIVIADWEMPGMNGPSLCRRIRDGRQDKYLYVLMFTVRGDSEDVVAALRSGADDYIVKGAPIAELLARLDSGRRMAATRASVRSRPQKRLQWLADVYARPRPPRHRPDLAIALAREFDRCRRRAAPISLVLCAPDDLAGLDERLGPDISRAFLEGVRAEIPKHLLESEWVARCGCEGFLVVLPDMILAGAQVVAQKIRTAMTNAAGHLGARTPISPTVSIGIAGIDAGRELTRWRPLDLLRAAEECLAQSRRAGGDRTTTTVLTDSQASSSS